MSQTLANRIKAFQDSFIPGVPEATLNTLMSELKNLIDSGIADQAVNTGERFPAFDLPDANNTQHSLEDYLRQGPLVVSFYRGAWCPYCNLEINALQQKLSEITAAGGQLVAISPQRPDKSSEQVATTGLSFDVLSDSGNKLAESCGLVFTLPEALRPIYAGWQIDIPGHNDDDSFQLPIPATYIIDTNGTINYAFIDMDYTRRLEPDIIIEQLKKL